MTGDTVPQEEEASATLNAAKEQPLISNASLLLLERKRESLIGQESPTGEEKGNSCSKCGNSVKPLVLEIFENLCTRC